MAAPRAEHLLRLDGLADHLGLARKWGEPSFEQEAVAACLRQAAPILKSAKVQTGEEVAAALAAHFAVQFESVRHPADISRLEDKYLKQKREIGFARLRDEISNPSVDALLFQRIEARPEEPDRWVAVLNLQGSDDRVYWSQFHELIHRIAEPAQKVLPFRRHRIESSNPLESLIDRIAGELAFYPPLFAPLVASMAATRLTFQVVNQLRTFFAPTASCLAVANAVAKHWPTPAIVVTASIKGRKRDPLKDRALRVSPQGRNHAAIVMGLSVIPNMRVPESSPIHTVFEKRSADGEEDLGAWTTSSGTRLPRRRVFTSSICLGKIAYAIISAANDDAL